MDIIRTFASSFMSVNKMGNEQSSQRMSEQETQQASQQKPWSPDDISVSSDEGGPSTGNGVPSSAGPGHSPISVQTPLNLNEKKSNKSRSSSGSYSRNRSTSSKATPVKAEVVTEPSSGMRRSPGQTKRNKFEQQEDEVAYPDINGISDDEPGTTPQQADQQDDDTIEVSMDSGFSQIGSQVRKTRLPCPHANTYDCNKTFSSLHSAKRHADLHLNPNKHSCPCCSKTFSRTDKLRMHKATHTQQEIDLAVANVESQLQMEVEADSELVNGDGSDADNNHSEDGAHSSRDGLQKIPESVPRIIKTGPQNVIAPDIVDQSSSKETPSSTSVFDQDVDTEVVAETPRPKSRLKRKRDTLNAGEAIPSPHEASRKRRRQHSFSPPTSVASEEEIVQTKENRVDDNNIPSDTTAPKLVPKLIHTNSILTGNLDGFAKPWTPGSQLYHPIHNPRSPKVESGQRKQVKVSQSSQAGPSARNAKTQAMLQMRTFQDSSDEQTPLAAKSRAVVYSSPKGKRKAESGIAYSSPSPRKAFEDEENAVEPAGMATSVARRGSSKVSSQKRPTKADVWEDQSDSDAGTEPEEDAKSERPFTCQECGARFKTRVGLLKHGKRPNVHAKKKVCEDCSKTFASDQKLKSHKCAANDSENVSLTGKKGAFSAAEVLKVQKWRDNFCHDNDIDVATFNQMMTDTCRRQKDIIWPYRFISKSDFLQEYFEVLPDRDRRSMRRYRERALQNVPEKQEWTEEDDAELVALVKEIGPKWVEIGQRMTRTQDSVSQRWRFKLQYMGKIHEGDWQPAEEAKLKAAVAQVKREAGLPPDLSADARVPWESVSKRLNGTRSARQCSNKWRLLFYLRKGNKWVKPSYADDTTGTTTATTTPSKMSQRLAGQTPSTKGQSSRKRYISQRYVEESDHGSHSDAGEEEAEASEAGSQHSVVNTKLSQPKRNQTHKAPRLEQSQEVMEVETPSIRRNPLSTKTPRTEHGLSQTFAQTQANTSALRAPNSVRMPHTQTEIPTPGVPIRRRPESSPWLAANDQSPMSETLEQEDEDAIMAEPQSSDVEADSKASALSESGTREISETSSSESSEESGEEVEAEAEAEAEVETDSDSVSQSSSSQSQNDDSTDSEAEDDDSDAMVQGAQKDLFVESLQSPSNPVFSSSQANQSSLHKKDWAKVIRGEASPSSAEGQTDSEDEGDIMHH